MFFPIFSAIFFSESSRLISRKQNQTKKRKKFRAVVGKIGGGNDRKNSQKSREKIGENRKVRKKKKKLRKKGTENLVKKMRKIGKTSEKLMKTLENIH